LRFKEYYLITRNTKKELGFEQELKANLQSAVTIFHGRFNWLKPSKQFATGVKLSPNKADYHFWLGVAYAANKESDLERKSYLRAIELDDKHVQALTYLGHNQLDKFEYENALNTYDKVLNLARQSISSL
jgi:tetratricopeptide (TPR) repeat protein